MCQNAMYMCSIYIYFKWSIGVGQLIEYTNFHLHEVPSLCRGVVTVYSIIILYRLLHRLHQRISNLGKVTISILNHSVIQLLFNYFHKVG